MRRFVMVPPVLACALLAVAAAPVVAAGEAFPKRVPLPGVPHERCLGAQALEGAGPVGLLCDWGENETGAGVVINHEEQAAPRR